MLVGNCQKFKPITQEKIEMTKKKGVTTSKCLSHKRNNYL